jgi:hypothetical protein
MEQPDEHNLANSPKDVFRQCEPYQSFRHVKHHHPAENQEDGGEYDEERRIDEFVLVLQ